MSKLILSLYDFTGNWPFYYRPEDGYVIQQIDIKRAHGGDVRWLAYIDRPVHGILAAPPCAPFAGSGAQYWKRKDTNGETLDGVSLVDAALRCVAIYKPEWWALENPVGRLRKWLGPPRLIFNPCDYGDAYTKRTCLWGDFQLPKKTPVTPIRACEQGSWVQRLGGKSERTKMLRSATPLGFAKAFREANP